MIKRYRWSRRGWTIAVTRMLSINYSSTSTKLWRTILTTRGAWWRTRWARVKMTMILLRRAI